MPAHRRSRFVGSSAQHEFANATVAFTDQRKRHIQQLEPKIGAFFAPRYYIISLSYVYLVGLKVIHIYSM